MTDRYTTRQLPITPTRTRVCLELPRGIKTSDLSGFVHFEK